MSILSKLPAQSAVLGFFRRGAADDCKSTAALCLRRLQFALSSVANGIASAAQTRVHPRAPERPQPPSMTNRLRAASTDGGNTKRRQLENRLDAPDKQFISGRHNIHASRHATGTFRPPPPPHPRLPVFLDFDFHKFPTPKNFIL